MQPTDGFLAKCIQLFDTINVRHGLMIVGAAYSGKTKVMEVLQRAITSLKGFENYVPVVL
jgi:dynein heavy chain